MKRLVLFILLTALLVATSVWLADRPGEVMIRWQGWRVDTSVPVALLLVVTAVAALLALARLVAAVLRSPGRFLRARRDRRRSEGYRALTDGLAAVASGDTRQAKKLAKRADKLLADRSLTGLLTAQAAEMTGDEAEARRRFEDMLGRAETAYLGLKGLLALALKAGDREAALDYARRAWALRPGAEDLATTLFELQALAGQWTEAEATLAEVKRRGSMAGAELLHRQALVLLERSRAAGPAQALDLAVKAHQADPMLVEATVEAAEHLHRAGKDRKAAAVIENTWRAAPHPALIEAHVALAPAETALQRVKRLEKLVKLNPDAADGHVALAEAAMAATLWGHARSHLDRAVALRPTAGIYILLAKLEREEKKDEPAAQAWLAKAATAAPEPAWMCVACGKAADRWSVTCPACGALDPLAWRQPAMGLLPAP